jgi:hypothetical protein
VADWNVVVVPFCSGKAICKVLVYTCKHLNLDLGEATCALPRLGDGLLPCFDPFGQFIEQR